MSHPEKPAVVITHDDIPIIIDDSSSMVVRCTGLRRQNTKLISTKEANALAIYRVIPGTGTIGVGAFAAVQRITVRVRGGGPQREMVVQLPTFEMDTAGELPNFETPTTDTIGRTVEKLKNIGGGPCRIVSVVVRVNNADLPAIDLSGPGKSVLVMHHVH